MSETQSYLQTHLSQIETNILLVKKLEPTIKDLTYNTKRYNEPVCLVLFYAEEDISNAIKKCMRQTDILHAIKIGDSYFHFVFLLFSTQEQSYTFVKHVEHEKLQNTPHYYYYEQLKATDYTNEFNFINSYLFNIKEQKEQHQA